MQVGFGFVLLFLKLFALVGQGGDGLAAGAEFFAELSVFFGELLLFGFQFLMQGLGLLLFFFQLFVIAQVQSGQGLFVFL